MEERTPAKRGNSVKKAEEEKCRGGRRIPSDEINIIIITEMSMYSRGQ